MRVAHPSEAGRIAAVQVAVWRRDFDGVLPDDVLAALPAEQFESMWRSAIRQPGEARSRVLVALGPAKAEGADSNETVVGFAAIGLSDDPDADTGADGLIHEFAIEPTYRNAGHGSRLMHAVIDTMRSDGMTRATIWLNTNADDVRAFFTQAGWAPDGAHRELDLHGDGSVRVKQVRLHCSTAAAGEGSGDGSGSPAQV